jgi:hypothetical protein
MAAVHLCSIGQEDITGKDVIDAPMRDLHLYRGSQA